MIETLYQENFQTAPTGVAMVPGRVNLIGEHTDYNGGMVLPAVIDNHIAVAVGPSRTGKDQFFSQGYGMAPNDPSIPLDEETWWVYAQGALAWAREHEIDVPPFAMAFNSTIPGGSGLSSSAAMLVGIFKALRTAKILALDNVEIALAAQAVENDYAGVPCGIMDQMAVSVGQAKMALALDTHTLDHTHLPLSPTHDFVVIHSGVTRKLTDGRYKQRRVECEEAQRLLGITEICKMSDQEMARLSDLPPVIEKRARHAVSEHRRVLKAVDALQAGQMTAFGTLMNESHASYRDDFEASTPQIDALVARAQQTGASGARLTGGGFGGCIVACVEKAIRPRWQENLCKEFQDIRVIC